MIGDDGDDDDDDSAFEVGAFENGHWIWDDMDECLEFIGHNEVSAFENIKANFQRVPVEAVVFKNELELIQQLTFRKKYMRKRADGEPDIITLQDVIDIVLFTAPKSIVSNTVIKMLHSSAGERFLRSLILYTQFYLQVSNVMKHRAAESIVKIRLPDSDKIEDTLRDDLAELKAIVAHEYHYLYTEFNSAGKRKRIRSLVVDSRLTEAFLRLSIQIVWIALSRPKFDVINNEINRLFRTNEYNIALTHYDKDLIKELSWQEKNVLFEENREEKLSGACFCRENDPTHKFDRISPAACNLLAFAKDYRTAGIGSMGFQVNKSSIRAEYLEKLLCAQEGVLVDEKIYIGILGQLRNKYDLMLVEIKISSDKQSMSASTSGLKVAKSSFSSKRSMTRSSSFRNEHRLEIPPTCDEKDIPLEFYQLPKKYVQRKPNSEQKRKWIKRFTARAQLKNSGSLFTLNSSRTGLLIM